MKAILITALAFLAHFGLLAQGIVSFSNFPSAPVTNSLTGERVIAGNTFLAALYYGPDDVTDPAQLIQLDGPVGFAFRGFFTGASRTTPSTTLPGGFAMFQY